MIYWWPVPVPVPLLLLAVMMFACRRFISGPISFLLRKSGGNSLQKPATGHVQREPQGYVDMLPCTALLGEFCSLKWSAKFCLSAT